MERLTLGAPLATDHDGGSFHALFTVAGSAVLEWDEGCQPLCRGDTWLIPAALRRYALRPEASAQILRVSVP
jgi:hypothetical protein